MTAEAPIPAPPELLRYAQDLEGGHFYEAHEALEDLWIMEVGPARELWKGLIMLAGALHHWRCDRRRPALVLWAGARRRLLRYPPAALGVALGPLRLWAEEHFARLEKGPSPCPSPPGRVLIPPTQQS